MNATTLKYDNIGNTSFVEMCKALNRMGVKNYDFMMKTNDPDLEAIMMYHQAPYESIELDYIVEECENNIWFFLREIAKIPQIDISEEFKLNEMNMAAIFCLEAGQSVYINSPRETFKTTSMLCWLAYKLAFKPETFTEINLIGGKPTNVKHLYDRLNAILNKIHILNNSVENLMGRVNAVTITSELDIKLKLNPGNNINLISDAEFMDLSLVTDLPGITIYESTLGEGDTSYIADFIKYHTLAFRNTIYDNAANLKNGDARETIYIKKHFYELGYGLKWYNAKCADLNYNEDFIRREIRLDRL